MPHRMKFLLTIMVLCYLLPCAVRAQDALRLNPLVSEGMVLQRGAGARIWGFAKAGTTVELRFRGKSYSTRVDVDGRWSQMVAPGQAGGPFGLEVLSGEQRIRLRKVYVGEVWFASGQSNMEWPISMLGVGAQDALAAPEDSLLRMIRVAKTWASRPRDTVAVYGWQGSDRVQRQNFSALGYFFGRQLRARLGVPVGIINCAYGGTPAEAWMSAQGLHPFPEFSKDLAMLARNPQEMEAAMRLEASQTEAAFRARWRAKAGIDSLVAYTPQAWKSSPPIGRRVYTMRAPGAWEDQGWPGYDGIAYYYTKQALPTGWDKARTQLLLGRVDDEDSTYVNGVLLGGNNLWSALRVYPVPPSALKGDSVYILVKVLDAGGGGGIFGEADLPNLSDGLRKLPLHDWRAVRTLDFARERVSLPSGGSSMPQKPAQLFNGMIMPTKDYTVKGVIWYQGEGNANRADQYRSLFPALIENWRARFQQPDMPFLFVQLAGYTGQMSGCGPSPWAELREAQRAALRLPHTGMATAFDLGDGADIHPKRKEELGYRLALEARRVAYGEKNLLSQGPMYERMAVSEGKVILHFQHAAGLKRINSALPLAGYCVAGEDQIWHEAEAVVVGETVHVSHPAVPKPVAVRYGWVNNPVQLNLVNQAGLPALPFRTDDWAFSTAGRVRD